MRLSAAEHVALLHPRGRGHVAFARAGREGGAGGWSERAVPVAEAGGVAEWLEGEADVYLSQQAFRGRRRVGGLLSLGALYADLDTYRVPALAGLAPEEITRRLLRRIGREGLAEPTLVMFTGRGLAAVWAHEALPARALPRWQAAEDRLLSLLAGFGADPAARDAARVLRLAGGVNGRSGLVVRPTHLGPRARFEALAAALLPRGRAEAAARRAPGRTGRGAERGPNRAGLNRASWAQALCDDVERLRAHRYGGRPVEVGARDLFLFCATVARSWLVPARDLPGAVAALGPGVGRSGARAVRSMKTCLDKAWQAARGGRVLQGGRRRDPRYTPKAETVRAWLGVTDHEARAAGLRLLVGPVLRAERERERWHARREAAGGVGRADYLRDARERARKAADLRGLGLPWAAVAREMAIASAEAARKLAARSGRGDADKSLRVASGVASGEARSGTARRAPGGVALPPGPLVPARDDAPPVSRTPESGPRRPGVGGAAPGVLHPVPLPRAPRRPVETPPAPALGVGAPRRARRSLRVLSAPGVPFPAADDPVLRARLREAGAEADARVRDGSRLTGACARVHDVLSRLRRAAGEDPALRAAWGRLHAGCVAYLLDLRARRRAALSEAGRERRAIAAASPEGKWFLRTAAVERAKRAVRPPPLYLGPAAV